MTQYLNSENEVVKELPPAPTIIVSKTQTAEQTVETDLNVKKIQVNSGIKQIKQAFHTQTPVTQNVVDNGTALSR